MELTYWCFQFLKKKKNLIKYGKSLSCSATACVFDVIKVMTELLVNNVGLICQINMSKMTILKRSYSGVLWQLSVVISNICGKKYLFFMDRFIFYICQHLMYKDPCALLAGTADGGWVVSVKSPIVKMYRKKIIVISKIHSMFDIIQFLESSFSSYCWVLAFQKQHFHCGQKTVCSDFLSTRDRRTCINKAV